MPIDDPLGSLRARLPRHGRMLDSLREVVRTDDRWRWLELGCSLGAGRGDELSDADVAIGYTGITDPDELAAAALSVASTVGQPVDMVAHRMDGWSEGLCRVAAVYDDGLQLDLVMIPASRRPGLPDRTIALVDKDDQLAVRWVPESRLPPSAEVAHEWVVLGWWALSDADKYIARDSLFEAIEAIAVARRLALQLHAAGQGVPYPSFGLVSLLDFAPYELPDGLADTYSTPGDRAGVVAAALACAQLLRTAVADSGLGASLDTSLAEATVGRLLTRR